MSRPILVAGMWRHGRGPVVASRYPADGTVVAEVATADAADVHEAVERAHALWGASGWGELAPHERAEVLFRAGELISDRHEDLAQLQRLDNGKPITETRALVSSAAGTFRYVAAACETMEDELTPPRGDYLTMSVHQPIGVVAAITPWNSPVASEAQKLAPALAAGNAVVLKPAEATPLVALELGRLLQHAGVPAGLVSVLPGEGPVVGDALVRHPLVGKVSFTGGTATGRQIAHVAADKMMPTTLELGGKSPTIVFDDAALDHAVAGVAFGIFGSAGQACVAGSRLFLHERVADRFLGALVAAAEGLRVGDPADPDTQIGPLISHEHRDRVEAHIRLAVEEGGRILVGGERPRGRAFEEGPYLLPTVVDGVSDGATVCQEEIFGPVLVVLRFSDEADLVARANDTVYGLAAGIWTGDYRRAWRVGRRLRAGTVWVNTYKQLSASTPFGGVGQSGVGREKGRLGIRSYMRQKSFYWGLNPEPLPWAAGAAP